MSKNRFPGDVVFNLFASILVFILSCTLCASETMAADKNRSCLEILGPEVELHLRSLNFPSINVSDESFYNFMEQMLNRLQELINTYPPSTHMLVGWGINTAFESAILASLFGEQYSEYFHSVPIRMRHWYTSQLERQERQQALSVFLPPAIQRQDRRLVLIRNLQGFGQVTANAVELIDFFRNEGFKELEFDLTFSHLEKFRNGEKLTPRFIHNRLSQSDHLLAIIRVYTPDDSNKAYQSTTFYPNEDQSLISVNIHLKHRPVINYPANRSYSVINGLGITPIYPYFIKEALNTAFEPEPSADFWRFVADLRGFIIENFSHHPLVRESNVGFFKTYNSQDHVGSVLLEAQ